MKEPRNVECKTCKGEGRIPRSGEGAKVLVWQTCFDCKGSGVDDFKTTDLWRLHFWRKSEILETRNAIALAALNVVRRSTEWSCMLPVEQEMVEQAISFLQTPLDDDTLVDRNF